MDYSLTQRVNDWFKDNWYWVLIAILLILLIVLIFKLKNKPKEIIEVPEPKTPAHITALAILKRLEKNWKKT